MTVNYQPPADHRADVRRQRWRRVNVVSVAVGAVVLPAVLLLPVEVRTDMGWVDARSGTYHRQTVWIFGFNGLRRETSSPFAYRLMRLGITWQPDWRQVEGTGRNIYGQAITRGHGPAPPAYDFTRFGTEELTDSEICRIYTILSNADPNIRDDEEEQQRAIQSIIDVSWARK
jgi:hypothetical protein